MNLDALKTQNGFHSILMSLSLLFTLLSPQLATNSNVIVVSTTIQAAVDAANPGDIVRVPPGTYHENVFVTKDNITIEGSAGAVLDGTSLTGSGVTVRSSIPSARINGFRLSGLRIQNFVRNGVILNRVDNYQIAHGDYIDNLAYGIFPIRSTHGLIEFNKVSGSDDTGSISVSPVRQSFVTIMSQTVRWLSVLKSARISLCKTIK